jgi:hypothetical protein
MKKLFMSLIVLMTIINTKQSQAIDITVGANTWYSWWDMNPGDSPDNFEYAPAVLYGPALSVKINDDVGLNTVFLYGIYVGDYSVYFDSLGEWRALPSETSRYDSDTSLSYRLSNNLKAFCGLKVTGYTFKTEAVPSLSMPDIEVKNTAYGPALGLNGVFPLPESFFIITNGSLLYLFGKSDNSFKGSSDIRCPGYNVSASLAYYISPAAVTLSIGGRYQYLNWDAVDNNGTDAAHKFYGITAAATYSFSI